MTARPWWPALLAAVLGAAGCGPPRPAENSVWEDARLPNPDAGLHTNVALTPPEGGTIVRLQSRYSRLNGAEPAEHQVRAAQVPLIAVYGWTERLALLGTVPVVRRRVHVEGPGESFSDAGVADVPLLAKWRVYQDDRLHRTTRLALLGGAEVPTFDSDFSSESLDPITGAVLTHQERRWWVDADMLYQLNTGGGRQGQDELRYDLAYSRRLLPPAVPAGRPWALYGVLELNGLSATDGSHELLGSPGLQLILPQAILEGGVQVPLFQDISTGRAELDFTYVLSVRVQF